MSDQPGSISGTPDPAPAPAPAAPVVPDGYVPRSELEKEQARARGFQSELSKTQAELQAARTPAPTAAATESGTPDIGTLVKGAVSDAVATVLRAGELRDAAAELRKEFPHADPSYFAKDRLTQFDSADSLRAAVEADHRRVADILKAHGVKVDEERREELAAAAAGGVGPMGGGTPVAGADPTVEELNAMTMAELDALEKAKPGTSLRVMGAAVTA